MQISADDRHHRGAHMRGTGRVGEEEDREVRRHALHAQQIDVLQTEREIKHLIIRPTNNKSREGIQ